MQELEWLGQIFMAVILGGILGWQRERWGKSAGPRTYALVTAGATLFTILSLHAFLTNDNSRVASQIITGIGFLGAGTILHREHRVEGLTTAAGLWASAAIGMTVGVGYYVLAIGATFLMLAVLVLHEDKIKQQFRNNGLGGNDKPLP